MDTDFVCFLQWPGIPDGFTQDLDASPGTAHESPQLQRSHTMSGSSDGGHAHQLFEDIPQPHPQFFFVPYTVTGHILGCVLL